MVVIGHLFSFSDKFREGMTRCESYPSLFWNYLFPDSPYLSFHNIVIYNEYIGLTYWFIRLIP